MQEINPLKKINLQQYQKPKTLIVVHYKGKRISVPLLGDCKNLTEMLYHHIDKFEQTVLKSDQKWEVLSYKKIVCFCSSSQTNQKRTKQDKSHSKQSNSINKNIQKFLKYQDGDLKIDILLSMIRIESDGAKPALDITKFYKYMEIQPFYIEYPISNGPDRKQNSLKHKYYLYRILQKNRLKNTYLARSLQDGYFYSIKVYRSGLKMAEHEAQFLSEAVNRFQSLVPQYLRNQNQSLGSPLSQDDIVPKTQICVIPSEEQEDQEDQSGQQFYKHLAMVQKWDNIKGKLSDRINDKNIKITEKDLLKYLKQLVWIVHQLHEEYNIIHRNITSESFEIDELGDLKLATFSSWVYCYNQNGTPILYPSDSISSRSDYSQESRMYEEQFQTVSDGWYYIGHYTPPQVLNKSKDGYGKWVDYYTIGVIIKEVYNKIYEFQIKSDNSTSSTLIQKMISCLTSPNVQEREQIVTELVQSIKKSKVQDTQTKHKQVSLSLNQIKLGQLISVDINQTCVENQNNDLQFNGISHQEIINYFKPVRQLKLSIYQGNGSQYQANQDKSKEKKKHFNLMKNQKNQLCKISNSRQKSVKSIKSNKSKQNSGTKSKIINQKGQKLQNKSKSRSTKKLKSPERSYLNTNKLISNPNSKHAKNHINDISIPSVVKKSKQKSCEKSLEKRRNEKKEKQKLLGHTICRTGNRSQQVQKSMSRTGVHVPLPKPPHKSPGRHV